MSINTSCLYAWKDSFLLQDTTFWVFSSFFCPFLLSLFIRPVLLSPNIKCWEFSDYNSVLSSTSFPMGPNLPTLILVNTQRTIIPQGIFLIQIWLHTSTWRNIELIMSKTQNHHPCHPNKNTISVSGFKTTQLCIPDPWESSLKCPVPHFSICNPFPIYPFPISSEIYPLVSTATITFSI